MAASELLNYSSGSVTFSPINGSGRVGTFADFVKSLPQMLKTFILNSRKQFSDFAFQCLVCKTCSGKNICRRKKSKCISILNNF